MSCRACRKAAHSLLCWPELCSSLAASYLNHPQCSEAERGAPASGCEHVFSRRQERRQASHQALRRACHGRHPSDPVGTSCGGRLACRLSKSRAARNVTHRCQARQNSAIRRYDQETSFQTERAGKLRTQCRSRDHARGGRNDSWTGASLPSKKPGLPLNLHSCATTAPRGSPGPASRQNRQLKP